MSLGLILVIILVIFLLGGFSGRFGGPGYGYGHRGNADDGVPTGAIKIGIGQTLIAVRFGSLAAVATARRCSQLPRWKRTLNPALLMSATRQHQTTSQNEYEG